MTVALEGVQTTLVPVLPRNNDPLVWERHNIPSERGFLLASPGCPIDVLQTTVSLAQPGRTDTQDFEYVGAGGLGAVYAKNEVAYKVHYPEKLDNMWPTSELLANIALTEGLKQISSDPITPTLYHREVPVSISGPQYFASFLPEHVFCRTGNPSRFIIAMSLEKGDLPTLDEVPDKRERLPYYHAAVANSGLHPLDVMYDDVDLYGDPKNLLYSPKANPHRIQLTKLDVMAAHDFAMREMGIF